MFSISAFLTDIISSRASSMKLIRQNWSPAPLLMKWDSQHIIHPWERDFINVIKLAFYEYKLFSYTAINSGVQIRPKLYFLYIIFFSFILYYLHLITDLVNSAESKIFLSNWVFFFLNVQNYTSLFIHSVM